MASPTGPRIDGPSAWHGDAASAGGPDDEEHARLDSALDEALDETFPASDPIAVHLPDVR
jgi:hypothetical protein